jgi:hypothetical protein
MGNENATWTDGLLAFYSSHVDEVVSQYQRINQLLGQTSDWIHPGNHCEVLIQTFLRKNLPTSMAVNKGYVAGLAERPAFGKQPVVTRHSPEIDILIHNCHRFAPVFSLNDFVIVEPEATLAMLEIKRTLDRKQCRRGITATVGAKWHTIKRFCEQKPHLSLTDIARLYSAVLSVRLDEKLNDAKRFTRTVAAALLAARKRFPTPMPENRPGISMLPQFVGSLQGYFTVMRPQCLSDWQVYHVFRSVQNERNIALLALLYTLSLFVCDSPPRGLADFPRILDQVDEFCIYKPKDSDEPLLRIGPPPKNPVPET